MPPRPVVPEKPRIPTLADTLGDPKLTYLDANGEWLLWEGKGFRLRYPKSCEPMNNLDGGYLFVVESPSDEYIRFFASEKPSKNKDLKGVVADFIAHYDTLQPKIDRNELFGEGVHPFQRVDLHWHFHSTGFLEIDKDMRTLTALWLHKGYVYQLSINTSSININPSDIDILEKIAMSLRFE